MIETRRDYYDYHGLNKCSAEILDVKYQKNGSAAVLLDKTIFYPEGGGPSFFQGSFSDTKTLEDFMTKLSAAFRA